MLQNLDKYVHEVETTASAAFWTARLSGGRSYLAGPMKGVLHCNYPKFLSLAKLGRDAMWDIQNPAVLGSKSGTVDARFDTAMRMPQIQGLVIISGLSLLSTCTTIIMLDDWEASNGAVIELLLAKRIGIEAISETAYRQCLEYRQYGNLIPTF
jgi:hypothetical protein